MSAMFKQILDTTCGLICSNSHALPSVSIDEPMPASYARSPSILLMSTSDCWKRASALSVLPFSK